MCRFCQQVALWCSLYHRHVRGHVLSYKHQDTYSAAVPASLIFTSDTPTHMFSQHIFIIMSFNYLPISTGCRSFYRSVYIFFPCSSVNAAVVCDLPFYEWHHRLEDGGVIKRMRTDEHMRGLKAEHNTAVFSVKSNFLLFCIHFYHL